MRVLNPKDVLLELSCNLHGSINENLNHLPLKYSRKVIINYLHSTFHHDKTTD